MFVCEYMYGMCTCMCVFVFPVGRTEVNIRNYPIPLPLYSVRHCVSRKSIAPLPSQPALGVPVSESQDWNHWLSQCLHELWVLNSDVHALMVMNW